MSPDVNDPAFRAVTFDDLYNVYTEQVDGLLDGGVDLLLVENHFRYAECESSRYGDP